MFGFPRVINPQTPAAKELDLLLDAKRGFVEPHAKQKTRPGAPFLREAWQVLLPQPYAPIWISQPKIWEKPYYAGV
jgi:hypothetical protein